MGQEFEGNKEEGLWNKAGRPWIEELNADFVLDHQWKAPFSPSLSGWWSLTQRNSFWPLDPRRTGSFSLDEAVGVGTGFRMEIQPLWVPGLWACLGSSVGWWEK